MMLCGIYSVIEISQITKLFLGWTRTHLQLLFCVITFILTVTPEKKYFNNFVWINSWRILWNSRVWWRDPSLNTPLPKSRSRRHIRRLSKEGKEGWYVQWNFNVVDVLADNCPKITCSMKRSLNYCTIGRISNLANHIEKKMVIIRV